MAVSTSTTVPISQGLRCTGLTSSGRACLLLAWHVSRGTLASLSARKYVLDALFHVKQRGFSCRAVARLRHAYPGVPRETHPGPLGLPPDSNVVMLRTRAITLEGKGNRPGLNGSLKPGGAGRTARAGSEMANTQCVTSRQLPGSTPSADWWPTCSGAGSLLTDMTAVRRQLYPPATDTVLRAAMVCFKEWERSRDVKLVLASVVVGLLRASIAPTASPGSAEIWMRIGCRGPFGH